MLIRVAVFVGDIMQLMTRGYYKATVHRVTAYDTNTPSAVGDDTVFAYSTNKDKGDGSFGASRRVQLKNRISCPFIIRGRHRTEIRPLAEYRRFPCKSLPVGYAPPLIRNSEDNVSVDDGTAHVIQGCSENESCTPSGPAHRVYDSANVIVDLPDFQETSMKMLHKLLDLKRHKCTRENQIDKNRQEEEERDWVLSAFAVTVYSEE